MNFGSNVSFKWYYVKKLQYNNYSSGNMYVTDQITSIKSFINKTANKIYQSLLLPF